MAVFWENVEKNVGDEFCEILRKHDEKLQETLRKFRENYSCQISRQIIRNR